MLLITVRATDESAPNILAAISTLVEPDQIEVFSPKPLPKVEQQDDPEFETLAAKIAEAIRPTAKQPMRPMALKMALLGWNTFMDQKGEADPTLRNAMGALSKALRPFFPYDSSPIERIATRTKIFEQKEGHYLGTRYAPTPLGVRVREILQQEGVM